MIVSDDKDNDENSPKRARLNSDDDVDELEGQEVSESGSGFICGLGKGSAVPGDDDPFPQCDLSQFGQQSEDASEWESRTLESVTGDGLYVTVGLNESQLERLYVTSPIPVQNRLFSYTFFCPPENYHLDGVQERVMTVILRRPLNIFLILILYQEPCQACVLRGRICLSVHGSVCMGCTVSKSKCSHRSNWARCFPDGAKGWHGSTPPFEWDVTFYNAQQSLFEVHGIPRQPTDLSFFQKAPNKFRQRFGRSSWLCPVVNSNPNSPILIRGRKLWSSPVQTSPVTSVDESVYSDNASDNEDIPRTRYGRPVRPSQRFGNVLSFGDLGNIQLRRTSDSHSAGASRSRRPRRPENLDALVTRVLSDRFPSPFEVDFARTEVSGVGGESEDWRRRLGRVLLAASQVEQVTEDALWCLQRLHRFQYVRGASVQLAPVSENVGQTRVPGGVGEDNSGHGGGSGVQRGSRGELL